jgi:hypothetical protein
MVAVEEEVVQASAVQLQEEEEVEEEGAMSDVASATSAASSSAAGGEQEEVEESSAAAAEHPYELLLDQVLGARPLQVPPHVSAVVRGDVVPAFGATPADTEMRSSSTTTSSSSNSGRLEEGEGGEALLSAADVAGANLHVQQQEGATGSAGPTPAAGSMGLPSLDVLDRGFVYGEDAAASVTSPVCSDGMGDASYTVVTTGDLQTTPSSGGVQENLADSLLGGLRSPTSPTEQQVQAAAVTGDGEQAGASGVVQDAAEEEREVVQEGAFPAAEHFGSSLMDSISSGRSVDSSSNKPAAVLQAPLEDAAPTLDQCSSPSAAVAAAAAGGLGGEEGVGSTPYASIHGSMYASIVAESDDMDASPNAAFLRSFNAALRAYGADPSQPQDAAEGGATGGSSEGGGSEEWTLVAEGEGAQEEEEGKQEVAAGSASGTGSGLFGRRR